MPTEYGEIVYRLAKLMENPIKDVAGEIGAKKARKGNRLSTGSGLLWFDVYLPDVLDSVIERNPDSGIEVILRPPLELDDMVSDGRPDLAVGEMPQERTSGIVYK